MDTDNLSQLKRFDYLEALGVPKFLYTKPTRTTKPNVQKIRVKCLVIETRGMHSFCKVGKTQDFLLKMLSAIKIAKNDIKCVAIDANDLDNILQQYDAKSVLLMSKNLFSDTKSHFHTHHPSEILANETLKRDAWETLKQLKNFLHKT